LTTRSPNLPGILDLHVHVFPPRLFEAVWAYFEERGWSVHHEQAEEIARTLRAHGVSRTVALSYPHKPGVARPLNRFMAELGQVEPLFIPFASVHVDDPDFVEYVDEAFASPYLHGFKFQPLVQRFDLNHPRLDLLYERCTTEDVPILIHAGLGPQRNEFVGFANFRRLLDRFPDLRVCVAHMGAPEYNEFLALLADHPRMYLDTTMVNVRTDLFDAVWRGDERLLLAHADRLCFGSDWPNVPYPYREAVESVNRFPLPPELVEDIRRRNGWRFLNLTALT